MQKDRNKSKKRGFCAAFFRAFSAVSGAVLFLMISILITGTFWISAETAPTSVISDNFLFVKTAFAQEPTIEQVPDDCRVINEKGDDNSTMPNSFPVGRCLSTKGQKESKFLPKVAGGQSATSTESTMSAQFVIINAVDLFVKLIATFSLIVFIIGAFITIISSGNDDLLGRGKTAMIYSVVGLGVAMLSFIIVTAVQSIFFNS